MDRAKRQRVTSLIVTLYVGFIILFIMLPIVIVIVMSFNEGRYFIFPPEKLSLRWYSRAFRSEWVNAFIISLRIAVMTAALATTVGVFSGLALTRGRFRGRQFLSSFFMSPLILPQLLLGLAMLFLLARVGLIGSSISLLLGHTLVTFPYVLRILLSALGSVPPSIEEAAMTLGANELSTTWRITLPIIKPAVFSSLVFAFILSFDNIMISLFLASARTITLPVKILNTIEQTADPTIAAISSIFIVISLGALLTIERSVDLQEISGA